MDKSAITPVNAEEAVGSSEPTVSPRGNSSPTAEPDGGEPEHRLAAQFAPSDGCGVDAAASPFARPTKPPLVFRDLTATASVGGRSVSVSLPGETPMDHLAVTSAVAATRAVTLLEAASMRSAPVEAAMLAEAVADRVVERLAPRGEPRRSDESLPLLIDYPEAARLLGIEPGALKVRVSDGRIPTNCIKRTGRRVQFIRSRLVEWIDGRDRRSRA